MEENIRISTINDFLFCPKSIYFHQLYEKYNQQVYKDMPQVRGTIAHESIDTKTYTTAKNVLQALDVYSEEYGLVGKIDTYDQDEKILMERKNYISKVYQGHIYQLYAQYFCMKEMGYDVQELKIWSKKDNKSYSIPLPTPEDTQKFKEFLQEYRKFSPNTPGFTQNPQKCAGCIYRELCDFYLGQK